MRVARFRIAVVACAWLGLVAMIPAGCASSNAARDPSVVVAPTRGGPPAHAPAHGYRRKLSQDGVSLIFDSGLGVYVVVDWSDVFFLEGRYFRLSGGAWTVSTEPRGSWKSVRVEELPAGLRSYTGSGARLKKGRGKSDH